MKREVGSVCDRGLSTKRPVNEDRALVRSDIGLFIVCDGVGGHSSGEVASQLAIDTIEEAVEAADSVDLLELLERAVQYANRDIFETARARPEFDGMATTVALLYLDETARRAIVGHAGDSRVYRFDGTTLQRETYDHTDLDDAIRAGRLSSEQALALGKQNTINRALGIENDVASEFKTIPLADFEVFLLCSDGVTRHIPDDEIEELLASGAAPQEVCDEIRSRCYARGAEDNLTAVVVRRGDAPAQTLRAVRAGARGTPQSKRFEVEFGETRARTPEPPAPRGLSPFVVTLFVLAVTVAAFAAGRASVALLTPPSIPPAAPAPIAAAKEAFERGNIPAARATLTQLEAQDATRAEYQYWLGRVALREGDGELAVKHLERAVSLDAALPDALPFLAAAYSVAGKTEQADATLRRFEQLERERVARAPGAPAR